MAKAGFRIDCRALEESYVLRLIPIPDCICPISQEIMCDPVSTADGSVYERACIEEWFKEKQQRKQALISPATGMRLQSKMLMPLVAFQRAVEAFLSNRPELHASLRDAYAAEARAETLRNGLQAQVVCLEQTVQDQRKELSQMQASERRLAKRLRTQKALNEANAETDLAELLHAAELKCGNLEDALAQARTDARQHVEAAVMTSTKLQGELAQANEQLSTFQDQFSKTKAEAGERIRDIEMRLEESARRRKEVEHRLETADTLCVALQDELGLSRMQRGAVEHALTQLKSDHQEHVRKVGAKFDASAQLKDEARTRMMAAEKLCIKLQEEIAQEKEHANGSRIKEQTHGVAAGHTQFSATCVPQVSHLNATLQLPVARKYKDNQLGSSAGDSLIRGRVLQDHTSRWLWQKDIVCNSSAAINRATPY